ncbi:uncharacterized protein NFIA_021340 [Aspergillus fischeri NRRL 181]|uniref:NACHT domain-containing protein n=1 Tax=Neosartorya fischeri (strain ATCC 1020 / DSM 3700 / CBS 544.65 / FGSC A1164 / JCM 1740 / NRRL 181 / WB 181) TaxID=331117 RepID=A1D4T3_NEOFI|nr:uncharacterized protein NFIA_021340 [Aspergillus fischeri NRRL 181]EAW23426.1 hypothetical protein NFIA_021340 [Aspergillus fischeri NRRL 181]
MGFRRWRSRLKGKKGESSSIDQPTVGGSSASPDTGPGTEEVKPNPSASVPEAKPEIEPLSEARKIWEEAYNLVKNDESLKSIVDEYEAEIISELQSLTADHDGHRTGATNTNTSLIGKIANLDPESRQNLMMRLVNKDGDRPDRFKTVSQISTVLESTKTTISSALDVYPPASMAWAGVCLVLTPVFNHVKGLKENWNGLTYIISRLPWTPEGNQKFKVPIRKEIVNLYRLIIEYQMLTFRACRHPSRDFAKNIVGLAEWTDRLQDIKSAEQQVNELVRHNHMTQVLVNLDEANKQSKSLQVLFENRDRLSEQNKLIQEFKPNPNQHDYQAYGAYFNHIVTPLEGTNYGVRNHPRFKRWESGEDRLLLLVGNPGTGKSVFTKSLLKDPSRPDSTTVCSFFFKDKSGQQNNANVALCKILYELFLAQGDLVAGVQEMVKRWDKDDIRWNLDKLWDVFERATQGAARDSIIVLLDALDEADPEQRTKLLERLRQSSSPSVKFLLTTRPIQPVLSIFEQRKEAILDLNDDPKCNQSLDDDIAKVADSRLERICQDKLIEQENLKAELRDQLEQHIRDNHTYLFVGLLFDYLDKQPMQRLPTKWIETFKSLPTTVSDAYRALLDNIRKEDQSDVKTMLQIVLAAQRPLTVREMNVALNISTIDGIHSAEDMQLISVEKFKRWIFQTCHFFLVIYDNRIHFIHQTVRDYLLPNQQEDKRPEWLADDFSEESCHQAIMKSCIQYISAPFVQAPRTTVNSLEQFFNAPLYTQLECQQWFYDLTQPRAASTIIEHGESPSVTKIEDSLRPSEETLRETHEFYEYAFTQWFVHLDFIRKHEKKKWPEILEDIQKQYVSMSFDLAEFIFCCSSLPSKKEVEVFTTMPSMGAGDRDLALSCLTQGLVTRYHRTSLMSELCYAIDLAKEVIGRTDTNDQRLGRRLVDISRAYMQRDMESSGDYAQLALETAVRAIEVTSPDHVDRSRALKARSNALSVRFLNKKDDEDINEAISDMESALNPTLYSLDKQDEALFLHDHAIYHGYRYLHSRAARRDTDLDRAITAAQQAVKGVSSRNPRRCNALHTLGVWLGVRARETKKKEHVDQAIEVHREALKSTPPTGADRASVLRRLASQLLLRYELEGSKDDLQEALGFACQAIHTIQEYHNLYPQCLDLHAQIRELAESENLQHGDCDVGYRSLTRCIHIQNISSKSRQ